MNRINLKKGLNQEVSNMSNRHTRKNGTKPMLPPILSGGFITGILIVIFILVMLFVVKDKIQGNTQHNNTPPAQETNAAQPPSIIAGSIEPSLILDQQQDGNVKLTYKIKNQTEHIQELTFKNDIKFDYILKDASGNIIKQQSKESQVESKTTTKSLVQAEELNFKIEFDNLEKGTYTLEAWLILDEGNKYTAKLDFKID